LHHALAPCRNALAASAVPIYLHFIKVAVLYRARRQNQFPVARLCNPFKLKLFAFLPVVEVTYEINLCCMRCPLAESLPL
jgi:hypothetical protein